MSPEDPRHGTPAGRHAHKTAGQDPCEPCRRAAARYEQELQLDHLAGRPRRVPATGTRRRLQALVALGHDFRRIGEALGIGQQGVSHLVHRTNPTVYATTATRVASLYEAWSMRLPSAATARDRRAATYARTNARRNRWLPPLAWDDIDHDPRPVAGAVLKHESRPMYVIDEVVVQRALAGQPVPCNIAERREIVARARNLGWPLDLITTRTGITKPERYLLPLDEQEAS